MMMPNDLRGRDGRIGLRILVAREFELQDRDSGLRVVMQTRLPDSTG